MAWAMGLEGHCVTLTYANDSQFGAEHISRFVTCLRKRLKYRGMTLPYVWVLEKAERIHYHLTVWLPTGFLLSHRDLKKMWCWGTTWTERCNDRGAKAWTRYLAKKETKLDLPVGARSFDGGGLDAEGKRAVLIRSMPKWVRALLPTHQNLTRRRGRWVDMRTGELFSSPWKWTARGFKFKPSDQSSHPLIQATDECLSLVWRPSVAEREPMRCRLGVRGTAQHDSCK